MTDAKIEGTNELEFPWAGTMATVFLVITGIVQFGSMIIAAYYIEQVIEEKKDELDAIPIDEEVRVLEEQTRQHNKAYEEVTLWPTVPFFAQFTLCTSLACMIVCCYLVTLFPAQCFRDYQLTYTIETHLDGDWTTLVKPLGNVANGIFVASLLLFYGFRSWANVSLMRNVEIITVLECILTIFYFNKNSAKQLKNVKRILLYILKMARRTKQRLRARG